MCLRRDLLKLFVTDRCDADSPEIEPTELPSRTPTSELDEIYMQILNHSQRKVDKERKKQLSMAFKRIVGTIVILSEALSTAALAKLLAVEKERITIRLRTLRSVLNVHVAVCLTRRKRVLMLLRTSILPDMCDVPFDSCHWHD